MKNKTGRRAFLKNIGAGGTAAAFLPAGMLLSPEENKTNEAIALYEYYTKTFPNIVVAQNDLGDLYLMTNQKEKAVQCYKNALAIRPGNPRATEALKRLN